MAGRIMVIGPAWWAASRVFLGPAGGLASPDRGATPHPRTGWRRRRGRVDQPDICERGFAALDRSAGGRRGAGHLRALIRRDPQPRRQRRVPAHGTPAARRLVGIPPPAPRQAARPDDGGPEIRCSRREVPEVDLARPGATFRYRRLGSALTSRDARAAASRRGSLLAGAPADAEGRSASFPDYDQDYLDRVQGDAPEARSGGAGWARDKNAIHIWPREPLHARSGFPNLDGSSPSPAHALRRGAVLRGLDTRRAEIFSTRFTTPSRTPH